MRNVLVTGATGCIGSHLTIKLLQLGYKVRAFHRATSNRLTLNNVDVEHFIGDIRDKNSLLGALAGCDAVFHTAAIVSFWKRRREEQMDINVNGTRCVVQACLECGIEKLVHTSSVAALGFRTDGKLIDETTPFNWGTHIAYKYSKYLSEIEVLRGVRRGLNATIVNPAIVIGARDVYVHGGQIVRDIRRGRIPVFVHGGMNIVSVHDVIHGHLEAAQKGGTGERYILSGENLTHKEVFTRTASAIGGRAPRVKVPIWLARAIATTSEFVGNMSKKQPWITPDLISGIGLNNWYSNEKARRDLGFTTSSIETAMREACEWYERNGMI